MWSFLLLTDKMVILNFLFLTEKGSAIIELFFGNIRGIMQIVKCSIKVENICGIIKKG
jgi:hypothetical protein